MFGPRHSSLEDFIPSGSSVSGPMGSFVLCQGRFPGGLLLLSATPPESDAAIFRCCRPYHLKKWLLYQRATCRRQSIINGFRRQGIN